MSISSAHSFIVAFYPFFIQSLFLRSGHRDERRCVAAGREQQRRRGHCYPQFDTARGAPGGRRTGGGNCGGACEAIQAGRKSIESVNFSVHTHLLYGLTY